MDKKYFISLLRKYLAGTATPEEQQFIIQYYNQFDSEPDVLEMLGSEQKDEYKNDIKSEIWKNISKSPDVPVVKITRLRKRITAIAAAAVFIAAISSAAFLFYSQPPAKQTAAAQAGLKKENRVILLPDGSTVVLSSGSRLNYPSTFEGKNKREVFLYGQAFFDIEHNASKPFIVHTGNVQTLVLDTAFNIKAIPAEADITVTVKRGKVKVSDQQKVLGIITPRQQIVYNKEKITSALKQVEDENYLSWQNQDLLFDNLTLDEAARLLGEKYKVEIVIKDPSVGSQHFTATFSKDEILENTLKSICEFNGLVYKYNKEDSLVFIGKK